MQPKSKITLFNDDMAMTLAAADFVLELAKEAVSTKGKFFIALSGGSTPQPLYRLLSKPPYLKEMPWEKTFMFWGDERYVPANDQQFNALAAKKNLIDHIPIPIENVFEVPTYLSPDAAALAYAGTIEHCFESHKPAFDLILLGIGENGHTASLFPHTAVLEQSDELVAAVYVEDLKMYRITMTAEFINTARHILFLVEGANKASVLHQILDGAYRPKDLPAQLIQPRSGSLNWFIEEKAANDLNGE